MFFLSISLMGASSPKNFGLGVMFGEPSGLTGKLWTTKNMAFDAGVAWSFKNDIVYIHINYLFHHFELVEVKKGSFGIYYGIGGAVVIFDSVHVGARVPLGLEYVFPGNQFEIFLEIVPGIALIPETDFYLSGGVGVRYYF